jgi:hypothetical protein
MKSLLAILFFLIAINAIGQTSKKDSITFCYIKYALPAGCSADSASTVKCGDWQMTWVYLNAEMLQSFTDQLVSQMAGRFKKFKEEPISCYLLDHPAKGYRLSFQKSGGTVHQLIAYGFANEQPVFVQVSLDKDPKSNEDIPAFARQMITLSHENLKEVASTGSAIK